MRSGAEALFLAALEVDPRERSAFLDTHCQDPDVRREVEGLLAEDAQSEAFLNTVVAHATESYYGAHGLTESSRVGSWRITHTLGRGGMATVYAAERADGGFTQKAAVKIIHPISAHSLSERFEREREILAGLSHSSIARLIDGGSQDGVPYLVMEYVEGLPLDEYCATKNLDLEARLRLFLPLCAAVEYAHSRLVVHRDLKPSNVLVTNEGEPKLLDFGVSKVLDEEGRGQTRTIALTPEYASPEQARGEEVTTATDVYGLGAVLYHLLTGRPPHALQGLSTAEVLHAVSEKMPVRLGIVRPELKGDLDNILLKALHTNPSRRYRSAREFAEDIERYLEKRPVRATPDGVAYRTKRFVERHWVGVIAVSAAVLALAALTFVSINEAHRAEHRFEQVRKLAHRFLFDFEKSIRDVSGTLPARQMVADTAREYLESLSAEAQDDPSLIAELAESNFRLGRIEWSMGKSAAAIDHFQQSLALLKQVKADCCASPALRRVYLLTLSELASTGRDAQNVDHAIAAGNEAVRLAREWRKSAPQEPAVEPTLMETLISQGGLLEAAGKQTEARQVLTEAVDLGAKVIRSNPRDEDQRYSLARAAYILAELCAALKDGPATRRYATMSHEILDQLIPLQPRNVRWQRLRVMAISSDANGLQLSSDREPALGPLAIEQARLAYQLVTTLSNNDPQNREVADLAVVMTQRLAGHFRLAGDRAAAVPLMAQAFAIVENLVEVDPKNQRYRYLRQNNRVLLAAILVELNRFGEARGVLSEAEKYLNEAMAGQPDDAVTLENKVTLLAIQTNVERHLGNVELARRLCRSGLELAARLIERDAAMESYLGSLPDLRREAKALGIPDPTAKTAAAR